MNNKKIGLNFNRKNPVRIKSKKKNYHKQNKLQLKELGPNLKN
jgi:uncharacterized protein YfaS (alpha-2-macroglobulin family)